MANTTAEYYKNLGQGKAVNQGPSPVPEQKKKNDVQIFIPGEGVQGLNDYSDKTSEKANTNNVLKLDTAEKEGNVEEAQKAIKSGLQANKDNNTKASDYLKEKADEYDVSLDEKKETPSAPVKTGSDLGGRTTEQWYLYMLQQGYNTDEIAELYEREGYSRAGEKFKKAAEKYKNWGKDTVSKDEIKDIVKETVADAGGTKEEEKTLLEKLKGKLTNKQLEDYAKENGITYGQALRYTIGGMLKGLANAQSPITGSKPFADEETLTPLQKRYKAVSGKVDEEAATTKAGEKRVTDYDSRKDAALVDADIAGKGNAQKDISEKSWVVDNGKDTLLDFAKLTADIKTIEDAQTLDTLEKRLGLERESAIALQKFLADIQVNSAYKMGWNEIQLEKDKVQALGNYLKDNPDAIENYQKYIRENKKGTMTEAELAGEWINNVASGVGTVAKTAVGLGSDRRIKNYLRVSGGK